MRVRDVMTEHVECIAPDATMCKAAEKMRDLDVGPLPVCSDDERLIGMITDRDITIRGVAEGLDPKRATVRDLMTPGIVCCHEEEDISAAIRLMKDNQIRRLVVLNHDNRLVGIVSLGDLAVDMGDDQLVGSTLEAISEPAHPAR